MFIVIVGDSTDWYAIGPFDSESDAEMYVVNRGADEESEQMEVRSLYAPIMFS